MLRIKEEYLAAGLRKQIGLLQGVLEDLDKKTAHSQEVMAEVRRVESELQRLRREIISLSDA